MALMWLSKKRKVPSNVSSDYRKCITDSMMFSINVSITVSAMTVLITILIFYAIDLTFYSGFFF